jgi:hypothetical protein
MDFPTLLCIVLILWDLFEINLIVRLRRAYPVEKRILIFVQIF